MQLPLRSLFQPSSYLIPFSLKWSSATSSGIPSTYVSPSIWEITIHTHITQRQNYSHKKPTTCTNFSNLLNLLMEWNSTCFGQFLRPSSGVFRCTHSNGICHTGLLTACEQDQDGTQSRPDPARNLYDIYHCCVYSEKTPDDRHRIVRNM